MENYKFTSEHSNMIVNAIVEGYSDYIEHRKDRNDKMIISSAFAWTKGNFIESQIAESCEASGFSYKMSKAGPTWNYLQFINDETKSLFMIKNASYFNPASFANSKLPVPGQKEGRARTYMHELSEINRNIVFPVYEQLTIDNYQEKEPLSLSYIHENEVNEQLDLFKQKYSSFHILTYRLDDAHQVSEVMHYLPNPVNNRAYPVENLTDYISGAELTNEEREILTSEGTDDLVDPEAFDLGILEDEREDE